MTMHLIRGMTTLNTKKPKQKSKTEAQLRAEREHAKFLASMGIGKSKKKKQTYKPTAFESNVNHIPSYGDMTGSTAKQQEKVYTGTEIIGIAQMHKSNAVPIRGKQSAVEVAKMRRG